MIIDDKVLFRLPKDRELQFPAMAVAQQYINTYDVRMAANDVSRGAVKYQLHYDLDMSSEDRAFWKQVKLKLTKYPEPISEPDMIADMREERLVQFDATGKHACQIFGVMCGIENKPKAIVREVKPKVDEARWCEIGFESEFGYTPIDGKDLLTLPDYYWTGVVAHASWETYLVACMGLPVVEILPRNRSRSWLSKFFHNEYRMVELAAGNVEQQVRLAIASIESSIMKKEICSPVTQAV